MPKGVKIGLIVTLVLLVVGGGTCAAIVTWAKANEPQWRAAGKEAGREGARFAEGKKEIACVDEAISRAGPCEGKSAITKGECYRVNAVFLRACLSAIEARALCDEAPKEKRAKTALSYARQKCPMGQAPCVKTYQQLARYCAEAAGAP